MAEPNSPLLEQLKMIGLMAETNAGTFNSNLTTPLAANFYEVKGGPGDVLAGGERKPQGGYVGQVASVPGKKPFEASFKFDIAPQGPLMTLLTGCGYVANGTTVAPSSNMTTRTTFSVAIWEAGRVKKGQGCALTIKISGQDGQKLMATVEAKGYSAGVSDAAMPAQAPITAAPYVVHGGADGVSNLLFNGAQMPHISKWEVDTGAQIEDRESVTSPLASHSLVGPIFPKITLDPEARKVADFDTWGGLASGATGTLTLSAIRAGSGTLTLTALAAQRAKVSDESRGTRIVDALELICAITAGDDALTITEAHP